MPSLMLGARKIAYSKIGSGAPVVLVHGSFATSSAWRKIVSKLDMGKFCAIAVDLPGCGGSDPVPLDSSRLLAMEAETVKAVITKESVGPVHLVGHSYGAVIVLSLALAERGLIRSLTLFEPTPISPYSRYGRRAGNR